MKLTLRKANAVQHSINEMIKSLDLNTTVTLNEFVEVKDQIQAVRDRFWTHSATRNKLILSLYEIRQMVANANAAAKSRIQLDSFALRPEENQSLSATDRHIYGAKKSTSTTVHVASTELRDEIGILMGNVSAISTTGVC